MKRKDGKSCGHKGCLNHVSHACEGCGRLGGIYAKQRAIGQSIEAIDNIVEHAKHNDPEFHEELKMIFAT